jgi:hypothetical protein
MESRGFVSWRGIPCLISALLVGCGGGGGGYNAPVTPPPAMPTIAFTAPMAAPTVNYGQAVMLTWTSTNSTSCTATTSSAMGGAFTGTQAASGSLAVAPTGPGTVIYTLNCTGAGGTASATTPMVTVNPSILSTLATASITKIGPTPDPVLMGGNPYGLVIAPATSGLITAGDLIVCNFNSANDNATGKQGNGTTIVGLHPTPGSSPYSIASSPSSAGCNALAMLPDDSISVAAYAANQNPLVNATGTVSTPFSADTFGEPWGEAYVAATSANPAALYVSNANGSIDRITLNSDSQTAFAQIASGFCGSGMPGAVYAPAGLTYDASIDTLYIVDTSSYSVVAFANVSSIGADGIVVDGQCSTTIPTPTPTFTGPSAMSARVLAHGGQFVAPISAALLSDGDLIVGNGDINLTTGSPNLAFEISPVLPGGFVGDPIQLDSGGPGALFGIAATTDSSGHQIVYFNDDNANAVMSISN